MSRPRLLDLFSGGGGCAVGYHRAGFEVVGYDKVAQPRYPFEFHQGDALEVLADRAYVESFDAVHASPPCKSENPLRHCHDVEHPDLLTPTLEILATYDIPWVVENVSATRKMPGALLMCGAAFGLGVMCRDDRRRPLKRHRLFASNVWLMGPGCACSGRSPVGVYGTGTNDAGNLARGTRYRADAGEAREAMGIDWMTKAELSQAIPPAYTEYIGEQLVDELTRRTPRKMCPSCRDRWNSALDSPLPPWPKTFAYCGNQRVEDMLDDRRRRADDHYGRIRDYQRWIERTCARGVEPCGVRTATPLIAYPVPSPQREAVPA